MDTRYVDLSKPPDLSASPFKPGAVPQSPAIKCQLCNAPMAAFDRHRGNPVLGWVLLVCGLLLGLGCVTILLAPFCIIPGVYCLQMQNFWRCTSCGYLIARA